MKRTILALGHELLSYRIHEVTPYINWIYFFHAWGFQPRFAAIANIHGCDSCRALWLTTFPEEERTKASEAMQLFKEANRMLDRLDETISIHCIFRLCQANADGDNLLIEGTTFPLLRQQTPQPDGGPFLCLSDFVRPLSSGTPDIVGLFASTISEEAEETYKSDPYKHLLVQTLNDRLAEAATEKMHEYVRKEAWGMPRRILVHSGSAGREIPRHPPRCGIPLPTRPIREFPAGRTARHEADRHHAD